MDDMSRIAVVRVGPASPDDGGTEVQFHLGDHLGSSAVVVDETGAVTNREEFTPYGETSFGSFARKRYRFTGKERDDESGLAYHEARHYQPWSGRWASADPLGASAGDNLYRYTSDNPLVHVDPDGMEEAFPPIEKSKQVTPKLKVWGGAVVEKPITDSDGNKVGEVDILKGKLKLDPKNLGVEGSGSVLDLEVTPKIAGPVRLVVSGAAVKAKVSVSLKKGVEADAVLYETGIGARAGPVGGKILFGMSAGFQLKNGKIKAKLVWGVGGELEVDVGKIIKPAKLPKPSGIVVPKIDTPDHDLPPVGPHIAFETVPPPPKQPTPHRRPKHPAHRPRQPMPATHGCAFGPEGPGQHMSMRHSADWRR
jgi:RHS repeat-associated protein